MESHPASASEVNGRDVEATFYKLLGSFQDEHHKMLQDIKKDTFDASLGQQIGITSDGNVGILIVVNQITAKMILDAMKGVVDHKCEAGNEAVISYMMYTAALLQGILPKMDCEIQKQRFFEHGETDA